MSQIVKELIQNVHGADDIQIISACRVTSSRKHGGYNTSNLKITVKLESQNQWNKLLRIAKKLRHEEIWNKVVTNPDLAAKERKMYF